jgi:hypothetical protein
MDLITILDYSMILMYNMILSLDSDFSGFASERERLVLASDDCLLLLVKLGLS